MSDSEDADYIFMCEDKIKKLESSNARLRGALEKIANPDHACLPFCDSCERIAIAREALNDKSVGTTEGEKA